mmetsp:Transcript_34623/g.35309  ORF Transcript_34623/g.35309 Transcript_34623/m.35309 type:complete len:255 (+) Transcript_34623:82-846(+)
MFIISRSIYILSLAILTSKISCLYQQHFFNCRTKHVSTNARQRPSLILKLLNDKEDEKLMEPIDDMPKKFNLRSLDDFEQRRSSVNQESSSRSTKRKEDEVLSSTSSSPAKSSATFGYLSIDELTGRMVDRETKPYYAGTEMPPERLVDLNGINPLTPLGFSIFPGVMSYVGFLGTQYMAAHFAINYVNSEYYPVQRAAIVLRNIVVGLFMMGTGFSGVVSIGLFCLGITVGLGIMKGELLPNKTSAAIENTKD